MTTAAPKRSRTIALAIGTLLLFVGFRYFNFYDRGKLNFSWKFKIGGSLLSPVVTTYFTWENPTPVAVTINAIEGVIKYEGEQIAMVSHVSPVKIAGNSKTNIPVSVQTTLKNFIKLVVQVVKDKSIANDFVFEGVITVEGGLHIPLKQKLSL